MTMWRYQLAFGLLLVVLGCRLIGLFLSFMENTGAVGVCFFGCIDTYTDTVNE